MASLAISSLTLLLAATGARAQLSGLTGGLSSGCQAAAASLLASDFATCANVLGLVSVVSASGSVIAPLNTYISNTCPSAPCSNATLQSAKSTLQGGCQTDINNEVPAAVALNTVITDYPDVRDLLCLQSTSNSSYCVTDTLTSIQTANGSDITVSSVSALLSGGVANLFRSLNNLPSGTYCTDCGHAIFTEAGKIGNNVSTSGTTSAQGAIASKCGQSFVDGQIPSSVKVAGSSSSSSPSSSSSSAPSSSSSNSAASPLFNRNGLVGGLAGVAAMVGAIGAGAVMILA